MSKNIDDLFGDLFGKSDRPRTISSGQAKQYRSTAQQSADALKQMEQADQQMNEHLRSQLNELRQMTSEMDLQRIEQEIEQDFGVTAQATGGSPQKKVGIEGFEEVLPMLKERVLGQDAFLQRLLIAFKRPYVAGYSADGARNSIFIHGRRATGRHSAVYAMADALCQRGVLETDKVQRMDLSIYPSQGEERLFLQDLYMALTAEGEVVIFDKFEECHPAFLGQLADLIIHGRVRLSNRYVLQKGRLIDAGNALTADIIGSIGAAGKYLVFIAEKGADKLAEFFGASFINALGDICATDRFSDEHLEEIARSRFEALKIRASERLSFELTAEDRLFTLLTEQYSQDAGVGGIVDYCDSMFKALAQYKLENDTKACTVALDVEDGVLMAQLGEERLDLMSLLPGQYKGELEAVKAEMAQVVGLSEIKQYIYSLEDHYKVQAMRKLEGMKTAPVSMHMIFTGNPGTGKTTIARLVSKYLKAIGVLSGGQLIEVTRADLVGKYVGHTAPLTTQVIKSAIGGVLFIDEAYSLYRGDQDSFGLEAIDTLVKGIEDNRDNLIVVLAGYSREMEEFMSANSGLRSRFPNIIEFPDYSGEELREIANLQAHSKGYIIDESAQSSLLDYFNVIQAMDSRESGNGRLARNVVEKAILDQSKRIVASHDKLNVLRPVDFDLFENP